MNKTIHVAVNMLLKDREYFVWRTTIVSTVLSYLFFKNILEAFLFTMYVWLHITFVIVVSESPSKYEFLEGIKDVQK